VWGGCDECGVVVRLGVWYVVVMVVVVRYLLPLHWNIRMGGIVAGGEDELSAAIGVQRQSRVLYAQDLSDNR